MKRLNIIAAVSVLIAFACAIPFFIGWNPEALFKFNEPPVSIRDIKQNSTADFTGAPAGADIPRLTGAEDFSKIIHLADYVTAEPVGIVQTGISSLKPWEDRSYTQRVNGRATGRQIRLPEVLSSGFDFSGSYQPITFWSFRIIPISWHRSKRDSEGNRKGRKSHPSHRS